MLVSQETFNTKTTLTDDWGSSHRIVLDLEALAEAKDWKIEVSLPDDYTIDQIYGGELTQENGKTYLSGVDWNRNMNQGSKTEVVLIVEEGNSSGSAPVLPQLVYAQPVDNSVTDNSATDGLVSQDTFDTKITLTDDWGSVHRIVLDLEAQAKAKDWKIEVSLPNDYTVDQIYGGELTQENGKTYLSGVDWNRNMNQGSKTEVVLIVEEGDSSGSAPILPQLVFADSVVESSDPVSESPAPSIAETAENSATITPVEEVVTTSPALAETTDNTDLVAETTGNGNIINVDNDFGGDLQSAIAAANDGDVVRLGGNVYYTDGITLNKDITIDGQRGSVINGNGTNNSIFTLYSEASGATIQDVEITNANNAITGNGVFDLTLQNLNINNIGLGQVMRDGQNNTGIVLNRADGLQLLNTVMSDIGRKGVGINDTDGALVSGLSVQNVNLDAQHAQSFDAAGIKFYNTNALTVQDSYFSNNNAMGIWSDTSSNITMEGNIIENVGADFLAPQFNTNVEIAGIYNEKSPNSIIRNNEATALDGFSAFNATEFSTESMTLEGNNFSSMAVNTTDYWVNESVEKLIANTEDPDAANFDLFADEYFAQANIG